jgi:putative FmdB family regulatory protein
MRVFDFQCDDCGALFEAFVRPGDDAQRCSGCGSAAVSRRPALPSVRAGAARRGRVIDLSSRSCPCGGAHRGSARR